MGGRVKIWLDLQVLMWLVGANDPNASLVLSSFPVLNFSVNLFIPIPITHSDQITAASYMVSSSCLG